MAKTLVARGQATINIQKDGYTITQSLGEYVFPADQNGKILSAISVTSTILVTQADSKFTNFTIGTVTKPTGFSAVTVNNSKKTVTFAVAANTTTLADHGSIEIPIVISSTTYHLTFVWSKAKKGATGNAGADANLLDWVKEWNNGKTLINSNTVVTPKLFAGTKNSDGTISGIAIGNFALSTKTASGTITTETVNGIYGFKDGYKTFFVDNGGNVQLGNGDQYIKYNPTTGKVEFGAGVSLNWIGATYIDKDGIFTGTLSANTVKAIDIDASQITSGTIAAKYINTTELKSTLITAANINALTLTTTKGTIGGWSIDSDSIYRGTKKNTSGTYTAASGSITIGSTGIRGYKWRLDSNGAGAIAGGNISWDASGNVTFASSVKLQWQNDIKTAQKANLGYPYYQKIIINGDENTYYPVVLKGGEQNIKRDILIRRGYSEQAPTTWNTATHKGGLILHLRANFGGWGGISYSWDIYDLSELYCRMFAGAKLCGNCCMFAIFLRGGGETGAAYHIYSNQPIVSSTMSPAPIPAAPQICYEEDQIFQSGTTSKAYAPPPRTLTADVEEEIRRHRFIVLSQSLDTTLTKHPLTYIGSTGIYTGTLTAAQVNAVNINASSILSGTLSADRIAAGSITSTKLDAASIKANIINTSYINGLSCTFTKGTIGGFTIGSNNLTVGSVGTIGATPIQIRTASSGSGYWYNGSYKPMGISLLWYQSSNAGHIILGQVATNGSTVKSNFIGLQMMSWDGQEYFCISANYTKSGGKEVYNRIAGWAFDHNHIWKNNISLSSDGSITNGTKWKLNNDGSGQIASGNISWDAAGNVTFADSVSLEWTGMIEDVYAEMDEYIYPNLSALDEELSNDIYPKLTKITATGVYTGSITASQITAGTISADRIAAGSITASKLDAASIKSDIINTSYINGLSCTFTQGKIGGWTIASGKLSTSQIAIDSANKRVVVYGSGASATSGVRAQLYYNSNSDFGFLATNSSGVAIAHFGSANRIAGWTITTDSISKGNVSLGSDGSITNGSKWKLNNDGSGQIASGNISWNASGTVTFGASVKTQWTTGITTAQELASAMAFGKMLYRDPTFYNGRNSTGVYNNTGNGNVTITRVQDTTAPNDSKYVLQIQTVGTASPMNGGFYFGTMCSARKVLVCRIIAKIPEGRRIIWASNSIGTGGTSRWLTDNAGTGDWKEYIYKVVCGTENFSSTHFYYINGTQGTAEEPLVWYVAYATVFDLTSTEKYTTTIDANGIYTGTVRANQVIIDSALTVGGSSYNGSISVKDANNAVKVTLDRTGITAVAGKIGGWAIGSSSLTAGAPSSGHRIVITNSGYIYHDNPNTGIDYWGLKSDGSAVFSQGKVSFKSDGSGSVANGNITWDTAGNITAQNGTFKNVEVIGTVRNAFILSDSSIYIGGTDPQMNLNKYDHVVAVRGSWDEVIPLPWTLEHSGRRVCLVNYKWGSNTTVGYMSITAPSGKYFYEDGIAKSTITFSREMVELLGYGDDTTFFGWIVTNRLDVMTTKKYGSCMKYLVQGQVTCSSTSSVSIKYRSFDGSTITVSRLGKGQYRIYMPSSWNMSGYYTVFVTGIYSTIESTPIYATLKAMYSYYFDVYTADDDSLNDGSFNFLVVSTGDW